MKLYRIKAKPGKRKTKPSRSRFATQPSRRQTIIDRSVYNLSFLPNPKWKDPVSTRVKYRGGAFHACRSFCAGSIIFGKVETPLIIDSTAPTREDALIDVRRHMKRYGVKLS